MSIQFECWNFFLLQIDFKSLIYVENFNENKTTV